jgi:NAD(P)-dependent dehydrogenase (short-subunit alcohol dehydrogenase family)
MSGKWTSDDIPDQSGKLAIVTGANSGLGRVTARELARHGAEVVVACRDTRKGEDAAAEIAAVASGPKPRVSELDLSSLESVRHFAEEHSGRPLDLLVNNAGVMMTPRRTTSDGFELQLGTNHFGHFALTGLLLDSLQQADAARVVTVSSNEHKGGRIDFDDLQEERDYNPRKSYQRSKLANAVFAIELSRRLQAAGSSVTSLFAHPGYSATNLQSTGPTGLMKGVLAIGNKLLAQSAEHGALPILYAGTSPEVEAGAYYGPDGFGEFRGSPTKTKAIPEAYDTETATRLWDVSEELTGVQYGRGLSRTDV